MGGEPPTEVELQRPSRRNSAAGCDAALWAHVTADICDTTPGPMSQNEAREQIAAFLVISLMETSLHLARYRLGGASADLGPARVAVMGETVSRVLDHPFGRPQIAWVQFRW